MKFNVYDVFLVDFKNNNGGELSGKHYAVILSKVTNPDKTIIVAPITSKKLDYNKIKSVTLADFLFAKKNSLKSIGKYKF